MKIPNATKEGMLLRKQTSLFEYSVSDTEERIQYVLILHRVQSRLMMFLQSPRLWPNPKPNRRELAR